MKMTEKKKQKTAKSTPKKEPSKKTENKVEPKKSVKKKKMDSSNVIAVIFVILFIGLMIYGIYSVRNRAMPQIIQEDYNGYTFVQDNAGHWVTIVKTVNGDTEIPFYYHPTELENLEYDMRINQLLSDVQNNNGKMVIAFGAELTNPELEGKGSQTVAAYEIIKTGINVFGMPVETAMIENLNGTNFTLSDCSKANSDTFVIEMRLGDESRVYSKDNCAIIEAENLTDTIKLADQLVYKIMGILPSNKI